MRLFWNIPPLKNAYIWTFNHLFWDPITPPVLIMTLKISKKIIYSNWSVSIKRLIVGWVVKPFLDLKILLLVDTFTLLPGTISMKVIVEEDVPLKVIMKFLVWKPKTEQRLGKFTRESSGKKNLRNNLRNGFMSQVKWKRNSKLMSFN